MLSSINIATAATVAACTATLSYYFYSHFRTKKQETVSELKDMYNLLPHPEGGFYAETYRSVLNVNASYGTRSASTAIYFLITPGSVSRLHKIAADECWHFYKGGSMTVLEIDSTGKLTRTILGHDLLNGEKVQHVVKAGTWFGSYPNKGTGYSFVGCTVAPGFDFQDFELASRSTLIKQFSQHEKEIKMLTEGLP